MKTRLWIAFAMLLASTTANAQTIGVSIGSKDKFRAILLDAIVSNGKTVPGVTMKVENADGDAGRQVEQLRKLVADKVDVVIMVAIDGDLGPQMTKIAKDAGIPMVYINTEPSNLAELPEKQIMVASNEKDSGTLQTAEVCRQMNGKGKAVVLMGQLFHFAARLRTQDIDDVLARPECKGIEIVERQAAYWSRDLADGQVQEWLAAGVKFDAVIANNDEMALGAINALKRRGVPMKDVIVAGVDATDDALAAMQAGDLDVTILQNAQGQGKMAVERAIALAKGETVGRENFVPFELVTQQNVAQYLPKTQ
jgi:ABC-type sugar transport system substrate-binding protein